MEKKTHKKITIGYVIQDYEEQEDGQLVCTEQCFIAGEVTYEDEGGEEITVDTEQEQYQPFNMIQPIKITNPDN